MPVHLHHSLSFRKACSGFPCLTSSFTVCGLSLQVYCLPVRSSCIGTDRCFSSWTPLLHSCCSNCGSCTCTAPQLLSCHNYTAPRLCHKWENHTLLDAWWILGLGLFALALLICTTARSKRLIGSHVPRGQAMANFPSSPTRMTFWLWLDLCCKK